MSDKVLISKCKGCGANVAAMLLTPASNAAQAGQQLVEAIAADRSAIIAEGPAYVSPCACQPTREVTAAEWRDKVAALERQIHQLKRPTAEERDQQWDAAMAMRRRVEDLLRTAEILQEAITVEQLKDAIHGPYKPC